MSKKLTKVEALKLITPVVDDEASAKERRAFMDFISDNEDVRRKYESMKKIKSLVDDRCPRAKAPSSLHRFVKDLDQLDQMAKENDQPVFDIPRGKGPIARPKDQQSKNEASQANLLSVSFSATIGMLVLFAAWALFTFSDFSPSVSANYNIEKNAYETFVKHKGEFVEPTISTASLGSAEIRMATDYDMSMTIPSLQDAEFKGVVYEDFVPNYEAPMLEYYLPSQDQYVYIFAFKLDKLKEFGQLVRDKEAVQQCDKPKDFHIRDINGKQVVSWKWNDVWYAAISNHDGNQLASLIKPLQYNPDDDQQ